MSDLGPRTSEDSASADAGDSRLNLQDWAHIATILTAPLALVALIFGVIQLSASSKTSEQQFAMEREIAANESWGRFMELSMEYPKFTSIGTEYQVDTTQFSNDDARIYPWFVQYAMFSGEQVLSFDAEDPEWNYAIEGEAFRHKEYLESPLFLESELCSYSFDLRELLSRVSPKISEANKECPAKIGMGASAFIGSLETESN